MEGSNSFLNGLSSAAGEFLRLRTDDLRKDIIKVISLGFSRVLLILVITMLLLIVLAIFTYALIIMTGEYIGSVCGAAFMVGGIYLLIVAVLILFRKRLFLNMFTRIFTEIIETEYEPRMISSPDSGNDNWRSLILILIRYLRKS